MSESHLRGADILRKFTNECCAKFPEATERNSFTKACHCLVTSTQPEEQWARRLGPVHDVM